MIEKGKISATQMSFLVYANIVATAILIIPGITYKHAKQDMWLSPIIGSLTGFLVVAVVYRLHKLYPAETLFEYSQHILGKIPGKVLGFFYLFYFLFAAGHTVRQYADFMVGTFLGKTPILMVMACLALASAFVVRAGLEVLGRLGEMFVPVLFLLWLILVLLLIPELDAGNMLPFMENGIGPVLRGAVGPLSWNLIFILIFALFPYLKDRRKGLKGGMFSVVAVMVTLFITNLATLMLFGNITGHFVYPVMSASRYISYAEFFENLEAIVMVIWMGGTFIKLGLYHYVIALGTAQSLNLSEYKPLALPFGLLITLFGLWAAPNLPSQAHHFVIASPFETLTFYLIIPVILLCIGLLRKRNGIVPASGPGQNSPADQEGAANVEDGREARPRADESEE